MANAFKQGKRKGRSSLAGLVAALEAAAENTLAENDPDYEEAAREDPDTARAETEARKQRRAEAERRRRQKLKEARDRAAKRLAQLERRQEEGKDVDDGKMRGAYTAMQQAHNAFVLSSKDPDRRATVQYGTNAAEMWWAKNKDRIHAEIDEEKTQRQQHQRQQRAQAQDAPTQAAMSAEPGYVDRQRIREGILQGQVPVLDPEALRQFGTGADDRAVLGWVGDVYGTGDEAKVQYVDKKNRWYSVKLGRAYNAGDVLLTPDGFIDPSSPVIPVESTLEGPVFWQRGSRGQPEFLEVPGWQAVGEVPDNPEYREDVRYTMGETIAKLVQSQWGDRQDVTRLQRVLFEGGYMGMVDSDYEIPYDPEDDSPVKMPRWGVFDKDTADAFEALLADQALALQEGKTIWEVAEAQRQSYLEQLGLSDFSAIYDSRKRPGSGGGGGGGGSKFSAPVSSEATVAQLADMVGQEVFGRRLTATERTAALELVRALEERDAQQAEAGGFYENTDPEAEIRKMLRQQNPEQAQKHDMLGAFSMFADLIGAGGGFGSAGFGQSTVGPAGGAGVFGG